MGALGKIMEDYRKSFFHVIIGDWICAVLIVAGLALSGSYADFPRVVPAVVCTIGMCGIAIWQTLGILVLERRRLIKRLNDLPEGDKEKILSQYASAHDIGKRWFLIRSAEPKGFKMELVLLDGKTERLGLGADENPAMIVAVLRSKNPLISVKLNGKIIEKMENRKDSAE